MRVARLALALLLAPIAAAAVPSAVSGDQGSALADEAVALAVELPAGYHRDIILRAISRNLRYFGQPDAGVRAARAMSDRGVDEVPLGAVPRLPRYVPLKEAMPTRSPCDAGIWREEGGGEAKTPSAREAWAEQCLLRRDFHWIGLPEVAEVKQVAAALPPGDIKGLVLAMLIRQYRDADSLGFVDREMIEHGTQLPAEARIGLTGLMANPTVQYRLKRKAQAIAAARASAGRDAKFEMIVLLLQDDDVSNAVAVFDTLDPAEPPEFSEGCDGWFDQIGGLQFWQVGTPYKPSASVGGFLDALANSPTFRKICPNGLGNEPAIRNLLIAGRYDAAIARARQERTQPFLLVDALLTAAEATLRTGERDRARAYAIAAGDALPPFDAGDRPPPLPPADTVAVVAIDTKMPEGPQRNFGEASGNTDRRFRVIRIIAATGAEAEAEQIARAQPAGAMRAVALSAAVAGRAGMRFDNQAPMLSSIEAANVWGVTLPTGR